MLISKINSLILYLYSHFEEIDYYIIIYIYLYFLYFDYQNNININFGLA
jgi:hypothetical protein